MDRINSYLSKDSTIKVKIPVSLDIYISFTADLMVGLGHLKATQGGLQSM